MKQNRFLTCTLALVLIGALLAAGCTSTVPPSESPKNDPDRLRRGSLTGAFSDIRDAYEKLHPDVKVDLVFDGSQTLRTQIEQGARADIFVSASEDHMKALQNQGLIDNDTVVYFLENRIAVITPADNPRGSRI